MSGSAGAHGPWGWRVGRHRRRRGVAGAVVHKGCAFGRGVRQRVRIVRLVMPVIVHLVRGASVHRTALGLTVATLRRVPVECVHVVAVHVPRMGLESHHVGRGGQAVTLTTLLLGDSSLRGEVAVRLVARREAGKPRGAADAVGMIGVGGARTAG